MFCGHAVFCDYNEVYFSQAKRRPAARQLRRWRAGHVHRAALAGRGARVCSPSRDRFVVLLAGPRERCTFFERFGISHGVSAQVSGTACRAPCHGSGRPLNPGQRPVSRGIHRLLEGGEFHAHRRPLETRRCLAGGAPRGRAPARAACKQGGITAGCGMRGSAGGGGAARPRARLSRLQARRDHGGAAARERAQAAAQLPAAAP